MRNSERSEQFLVRECFLILFLKLEFDKLEQLEFILEKIMGFRNMQEKLENDLAQQLQLFSIHLISFLILWKSSSYERCIASIASSKKKWLIFSQRHFKSTITNMTKNIKTNTFWKCVQGLSISEGKKCFFRAQHEKPRYI